MGRVGISLLNIIRSSEHNVILCGDLASYGDIVRRRHGDVTRVSVGGRISRYGATKHQLFARNGKVPCTCISARNGDVICTDNRHGGVIRINVHGSNRHGLSVVRSDRDDFIVFCFNDAEILVRRNGQSRIIRGVVSIEGVGCTGILVSRNREGRASCGGKGVGIGSLVGRELNTARNNASAPYI